MLFYFTATGNSLYVAKRVDAKLISIPQIINNDNLIFEDESIGIVWPVYATNLCQEYGIHVDYIHSILMVDNYLPSFDMNEQMAIDKKIDEQLKVVLKGVKERKKKFQ